MANTHDTRFADSDIGRVLERRVRRPRALLAADVYLAITAVALARLVLLALLVPGFLESRDNVPPLVVDAALSVPQAAAAFVLPMLLAVLALIATRRPGKTPWSWTHLASGWLVVAFGELWLASADFTAAILALGAIPAVLIGSNLTYLRQIAGLPWKSRPWTPLRFVLIALVAAAVFAFFVVYLVGGALGIGSGLIFRTYAGPFAR